MQPDQALGQVCFFAAANFVNASAAPNFPADYFFRQEAMRRLCGLAVRLWQQPEQLAIYQLYPLVLVKQRERQQMRRPLECLQRIVIFRKWLFT